MGAEPFMQSQQRVRVFPNLSNGPLRFRGRGDSRRNGKEKPPTFFWETEKLRHPTPVSSRRVSHLISHCQSRVSAA